MITFTVHSYILPVKWWGGWEGDENMRLTVDPQEGLLVSLLRLERKLHSRGKGERCSINNAVSISNVWVHWFKREFGL